MAHDLVEAFVGYFGYPTSGPKAERYAVVVASLLKAAQVHVSSASDDKPHYVGIQRRASAWSRYPLVGRTVSDAVVDDFLGQFGGQLVEGSGTSGLYKDDQGNWRTDLKMSRLTTQMCTNHPTKICSQVHNSYLLELSLHA